MSSLGVDLRDWFRPGSGVTIRFLLARLRWVAYDSPLAIALRAEDEKPTEKPTVERLKQREQEIRERRAKEVTRG